MLLQEPQDSDSPQHAYIDTRGCLRAGWWAETQKSDLIKGVGGGGKKRAQSCRVQPVTGGQSEHKLTFVLQRGRPRSSEDSQAFFCPVSFP